MWRLVLSVGLLCWGSEGTAVTCRDNNNGPVDWYILYKAPTHESLGGVEYIYIDANGEQKMEPQKPTALPGGTTPSASTYKPINHPEGVLANTLRPLFRAVRSMPNNFGFISYSDQPPGCNAHEEFGHSKGVLMVDKTNTGVWLLHSTPQFPFRRDQNNFFPESGKRNAQTFICVTFPYDQFRQIGEHLQYIGAFPFEHDIPADFHRELRDAVNQVQRPPLSNFQQLTSSGLNNFYSIAKQMSTTAKVGDLYVSIAQRVSSDLNVQTWGCQKGRARSYCLPHGQKVINVKTIRTGLGQWDPKHDHSKWCVARDQNNHWTCIADVNRAKSQYARRGGALCFENVKIKPIFLRYAVGIEDCPTGNIMDIVDATDPECDPDPDALTDVPDRHVDASLMG